MHLLAPTIKREYIKRSSIELSMFTGLRHLLFNNTTLKLVIPIECRGEPKHITYKAIKRYLNITEIQDSTELCSLLLAYQLTKTDHKIGTSVYIGFQLTNADSNPESPSYLTCFSFSIQTQPTFHNRNVLTFDHAISECRTIFLLISMAKQILSRTAFRNKLAKFVKKNITIVIKDTI